MGISMRGRFKRLFKTPYEPNVLIPRFVDGEEVGFWIPRDVNEELLRDIPDIETLVYADGTEPGTGRRRPDLWIRRVREELRAFQTWVSNVERMGGRPLFKGLTPDARNPRLFYCYYLPPGGGEPVMFKIKLPLKYPERPPRTEGLKVMSYARFRKPGTGEPCLGRLEEENWRRNWQRWGIAHYLALVGLYEATKQGLSIKRLERMRER